MIFHFVDSSLLFQGPRRGTGELCRVFFRLTFLLPFYIFFFNTPHFPHSAFSTLLIFYTSRFLRSAFSTPHFLHSAFPHSKFSTLRTPHSALGTPHSPFSTEPVGLHFISSVKTCRLQCVSSVDEECLTSLSN